MNDKQRWWMVWWLGLGLSGVLVFVPGSALAETVPPEAESPETVSPETVLAKTVPAEIVIDEVEPSVVDSGDFVILRGDFSGVETASVYVDGEVGIPLEVVQITDDEIVCRAEATPWSVTGPVRILTRGTTIALPPQTLEREGVTIEGWSRITVAPQVAEGGLLTIAGPSDDQASHTLAVDGTMETAIALRSCIGSTYFIVIEPDSLISPQGIPCYPALVDLETLSSVDPSTLDPAQQAQDLAALFNLSFAGTGLSMDPVGSTSTVSTFLLSHEECPLHSGSVTVQCADR